MSVLGVITNERISWEEADRLLRPDTLDPDAALELDEVLFLSQCLWPEHEIGSDHFDRLKTAMNVVLSLAGVLVD